MVSPGAGYDGSPAEQKLPVDLVLVPEGAEGIGSPNCPAERVSGERGKKRPPLREGVVAVPEVDVGQVVKGALEYSDTSTERAMVAAIRRGELRGDRRVPRVPGARGRPRDARTAPSPALQLQTKFGNDSDRSRWEVVDHNPTWSTRRIVISP